MGDSPNNPPTPKASAKEPPGPSTHYLIRGVGAKIATTALNPSWSGLDSETSNALHTLSFCNELNAELGSNSTLRAGLIVAFARMYEQLDEGRGKVIEELENEKAGWASEKKRLESKIEELEAEKKGLEIERDEARADNSLETLHVIQKAAADEIARLRGAPATQDRKT
ncbi:hypothetical protein AURDEDRAFT_168112 [Auricularia subglabra TFB-10046 SS5]|nr:hypothetical protein AURDEDRAFT_168112 [Auricularia subglabra TFB-10046 SS5]